MAYRTGTGRVVLLHTTLPECAPNMWTYIPNPKKICHGPLKVPGIANLPENEVLTLSQHVSDFEANVMQVTCMQCTPDWFLMRMFRFTSSVACKILQKFKAKIMNDIQEENDDDKLEQIQLAMQIVPMLKCLGMQCKELQNVAHAAAEKAVLAPQVVMNENLINECNNETYEASEQLEEQSIRNFVVSEHEKDVERPYAKETHGIFFCSACGVRIDDQHTPCKYIFESYATHMS